MDVESALSVLEIQQLASRYSVVVDGRDMAGLADLFVPDVRVGDERGREALARWYGQGLRTVGATIHMIGNHVIDVDGDVGTGVVYCREEVQQLGTDEWRVGMLQYWDTYRRVDGRWFFERRRVARWYAEPVPQARPLGAVEGPAARERSLPEAFPHWAAFLL